MLLLIFVGKVFNRFETEGGHTGPPSVSNPSIRMGRNGINIQMEVINSNHFEFQTIPDWISPNFRSDHSGFPASCN